MMTAMDTGKQHFKDMANVARAQFDGADIECLKKEYEAVVRKDERRRCRMAMKFRPDSETRTKMVTLYDVLMRRGIAADALKEMEKAIREDTFNRHFAQKIGGRE